MNKLLLIKEMKDCIDNKTPIEFFSKLTDTLGFLCDKIETLEKELVKTRLTSVLAIKWDSRFALQMIEEQIDSYRGTNATFYQDQVDELKRAYKEDLVTQSYDTFVAFWQDVVGVHPFMHYED